MHRAIRAAPVVLCALLVWPRPAAAQAPAPPIQGVTGTIATEGSKDGVKKAAGAAARGVKKVLPGGNGASENPLDVLIAGTHVVVRDMAEGSDAAKTGVEGVVIDVNRSRKQITVRRPDKTIDTLRVMDATGSGAHVTVSLSDQANARPYDFRRVS